MNKFKTTLLSLAVMVGIMGTVSVLAPSYVSAAPKDAINEGVKAAGGDTDTVTLGARLKDIVNILLYILGAIAVIMIVIGGIRYTTSNGDSSGISGAKNTILYAVVGLIVAMLAYAIVNFVVGAF